MAGPFLLLGRKTAFPVRTMQSEGCFYFKLFRVVRVLPVVVIFSRCNREKLLYTCIVHTFLLYFAIKHNSVLFFHSSTTVLVLLIIFFRNASTVTKHTSRIPRIRMNLI